jgi:hypothetical protein
MRFHSVTVCLTCGSDLRLMRNKLIELGFYVPRRSYGFGGLEDSAKKVPDVKVNSQTRGLSIPRHPEASLLGFTYGTELTAAQQHTDLSIPLLPQGSENARRLDWK